MDIILRPGFIKKVIIWTLIGINLIFIGISIYFFYTVKEGYNDCMKTYVKEIKKNKYITGYYYKTDWGSYHIDTKRFTKQDGYRIIGDTRNCIFFIRDGRYIIENIFNMYYCGITYLLIN